MKLGEARDFFRAVRPVLKNALTSGQIFRPQCVLTEPDPDILCEFDVEIPLLAKLHKTKNNRKPKTTENQKQQDGAPREASSRTGQTEKTTNEHALRVSSGGEG